MEWWNDGSKTVIQYSNIPTLRLLVTSYILRAELTSAGGEAVKFYSLSHGWLFWESRHGTPKNASRDCTPGARRTIP